MGPTAAGRARAPGASGRVPARPRPPLRRAASIVVSLLLAAVATGIVLASISSRLSPGGQPTVLGHPTFAVLSGSMGSTIRTGDLAVDDRLSRTRARDLHAGQIITFRSAGAGSRLFTHRIVVVRRSLDNTVSYVTRGDANDSADATLVDSGQVVGLYRFRVPYGGYALDRLHHPAGALLIVLAAALLVVGRRLLRLARAAPRNPKRVPRPLVVGTVALVTAGAAAAGTTLGLFTSTPASGSNGFTAGTIALSANSSGACNVSGLMPGDAPAPCTYVATYTGTASAYLGLDVLIQTQAGSGGGPLYSPPASNNALTVAITDNQGTPVTYAVPTTTSTCPGTAPVGSTCYQLTNLLVRTTPVTASTAVTFSTAVTLPLAAGNTTQGAAAQVVLTAHAVQSKNQTLPVGCTAGAVCATTGTFSWS